MSSKKEKKKKKSSKSKGNKEKYTKNKKQPKAIQEKRRKKLIVILLAVILFIVILLALMRQFIWRVDGSSMEPTFSSGDLAVVKYQKDIVRYDIVAFKTADPTTKNKYLVKRVVGVPGDVVEVRAEKMSIVYQTSKKKNSDSEVNLTYPILPNTRDMKIQKIEIPENKFFVVGDNVWGSYDSRNFGLIDRDQIEGTIMTK